MQNRIELISGNELQSLLSEANEVIRIVAKFVIAAREEVILQFALCNLHFTMLYSRSYLCNFVNTRG